MNTKPTNNRENSGITSAPASSTSAAAGAVSGGGPVRTNPRHTRYFETTDGTAFIPVGLNLCFPRHVVDRAEGLDKMLGWLDRLSENGGNFARIFMGHAFFDIECGAFATFDEENATRLDAVLDHAWTRGVRLKFTIDLFRDIQLVRQTESFPGAVSFSKPNFHVGRGGPFCKMDDYLRSQQGRNHFLRKLDWLAARYGAHPGIFGWDLWNEMNAVASEHWLEWTRAMLPELKKRFPLHLAMQTLGSMDADHTLPQYAEIMGLPANEVSQAHRYLDLGAEWDVCHGPIDVMAADAVTTLLSIAPDKPALLAEGGAVEWRHSAPWRLYPADKEGVLMHDVLFASFFAGAAGCGQMWHWQEYVGPNNLWWHFARFTRAIEGIDPIKEHLTPWREDTGCLRVYGLQGRNVRLAWCRDAGSDWRTELVDSTEPSVIKDATITPPSRREPGHGVTFYDPWTDKTGKGAVSAEGTITLPPFRRSIVVRF